jgi:hypothetical protein
MNGILLQSQITSTHLIQSVVNASGEDIITVRKEWSGHTQLVSRPPHSMYVAQTLIAHKQATLPITVLHLSMIELTQSFCVLITQFLVAMSEMLLLVLLG